MPSVLSPKERYEQELQKIIVSIYMLRNRYSKDYDMILEDISIVIRSSKFIKASNQSAITQFVDEYQKRVIGDD